MCANLVNLTSWLKTRDQRIAAQRAKHATIHGSILELKVPRHVEERLPTSPSSPLDPDVTDGLQNYIPDLAKTNPRHQVTLMTPSWSDRPSY